MMYLFNLRYFDQKMDCEDLIALLDNNCVAYSVKETRDGLGKLVISEKEVVNYNCYRVN